MATRRYRPKILISAGSLVAAASLGLSACGTGQSAADAQLQAGVSSLTSSPQATFALHVDTTASQVEALPGHPSANDARLVAGGSVVIEAATASGQPLSSLESTSGSLQQRLAAVRLDVLGELDGSPLVELRVVGGVLYGQLNVAGLDSVLAGFGQNLTTAEGQLPPSVAANPAVQALFNGRWVSVDLGTLLTELRSAGVHLNRPGSTPSATDVGGILDALTATFNKEVDVTRVGTSATLGTDLLLSTDRHSFATELASSLARAVPSLVTNKDVSRAEAVPHRPFQVHAYVAGGTLTRLSVDLSQLTGEGQLPAGTEIPLVLDVSHAPVTINAPAGAVPLDVKTLLQEAVGSSP
jgi:hypothetical protein